MVLTIFRQMILCYPISELVVFIVAIITVMSNGIFNSMGYMPWHFRDRSERVIHVHKKDDDLYECCFM